MYKSKSVLRLRYLKKRKKNYSGKILFKINKIFDLIRDNFSHKKITVAGYYPSNFEVNILEFLTQISKKNFKVCLPVIKANRKMVFKSWTTNEPLYVNKFGILEPNKFNTLL